MVIGGGGSEDNTLHDKYLLLYFNKEHSLPTQTANHNEISRKKKLPKGWEWWHTPIIPMLWKGGFKITLGHTANSRPELH